MLLLVLLFLLCHLSAKSGVRPPGWVGFCSELVWPLSSSYINVINLKTSFRNNPNLTKPKQLLTNQMQYVIDCSFALDFHPHPYSQPAFLFMLGFEEPNPSEQLPWAQKCHLEPTAAERRTQSPLPPWVLPWYPCSHFPIDKDFAQACYLFAGIFHLNKFLMFYIARMPLPFKEGSMQ